MGAAIAPPFISPRLPPGDMQPFPPFANSPYFPLPDLEPYFPLPGTPPYISGGLAHSSDANPYIALAQARQDNAEHEAHMRFMEEMRQFNDREFAGYIPHTPVLHQDTTTQDSIREFVQITGQDSQTALIWLARYGGNKELAIQSFFAQTL